MSSLHARRPPKLQQGDLRRKSKQSRDTAIIKGGGGSLRRPPTTGEGPRVNGSGNKRGMSTMKNICRIFKMIACIGVVLALAVPLFRLRNLIWNDTPGLRANNNHSVESINNANIPVEPG